MTEQQLKEAKQYIRTRSKNIIYILSQLEPNDDNSDLYTRINNCLEDISLAISVMKHNEKHNTNKPIKSNVNWF